MISNNFKNELKDQRDIIKSIEAQGGFAKKWNSKYQVGLPDLVCALPDIGGFFMEVKAIAPNWENVDPTQFCSYKLRVTSMQRQIMNHINRSGAHVMIAVVIYGPNRPSRSKRLYLLHHGSDRIDLIQGKFNAPYAHKINGLYDINRTIIEFIKTI